VIEAAPDVISHNMETVRALYEKVRPHADYDRSLEVLRRIAAQPTQGDFSVLRIKCKSGIMVGVGETDEQVLELMDDLREVGCTLLTIGQYLRPSPENIPVEEYIKPETFDHWAEEAQKKGFEFVASSPFVRSSYHAEEAMK
jgi:lipoic acid synthetase